jgi:hypothetical protein
VTAANPNGLLIDAVFSAQTLLQNNPSGHLSPAPTLDKQ